MAAKKIYTVIKEGKTIEELKTLTAAKKLADEKAAEVFCDGKCVYAKTAPSDSAADKLSSERYRIKVLMNVRNRPSFQGEVLGTKVKDTVVEVIQLKDNWLHLSDGTYILYGNGKFAEKI